MAKKTPTPNALVPHVPEVPKTFTASFDGQKMRHVTIAGEPWFVAADVCRCLGLNMDKGATRFTAKMASDQKMTLRKIDAKGPDFDSRTLFVGPESMHTLLSESGLYKLVMRSDKPIARTFQDWADRHLFLNSALRQEGHSKLPAHAAASSPLSFQGHRVRHILIDGDPWFVAVDVCECLGLPVGKSGVYNHLLKLDACEKGPVSRTEYPELFSGLRGGPLTAISESGLYKLILRAQPSRPEVKAFQDWVTREVLPSIRKTGGYLLNEEARSTAAVSPQMPTSFADALRRYADEVDKREQAEKLAIELQVPDGTLPSGKNRVVPTPSFRPNLVPSRGRMGPEK